MSQTDVLFEILTDMNGRVGSLQHAAEQADNQRQILFDQIRQLNDRMADIAAVASEIEKIRPTVEWIEKTKHRAAGIIAGFTLAASALGVLMGDAIRALFKAAP